MTTTNTANAPASIAAGSYDDPMNPNDLVIGPSISPHIEALMERHSHLARRFLGKGHSGPMPKVATPDDFDLEVLRLLILKGVVDVPELATALWHRPNSNARSHGKQYVLDSVLGVLAKLAADNDSAVSRKPDFVVDDLLVYSGPEPVYAFTIDGVRFFVKHKELMKPSSFTSRYVAELKRAPGGLPGDRDQSGWLEVLNDWLNGARFKELGDDSDPRAALGDAIDLVLEGLLDGEDAADLDMHKCVRDPSIGLLFVKMPTLIVALKSRGIERPDPTEVALNLHPRGTWGRHSIGGITAKCWALRMANAQAAAPSSAVTPSAPTPASPVPQLTPGPAASADASTNIGSDSAGAKPLSPAMQVSASANDSPADLKRGAA